MRQIRRPSPASVGNAFHEQDLLEKYVCRDAEFILMARWVTMCVMLGKPTAAERAWL